MAPSSVGSNSKSATPATPQRRSPSLSLSQRTASHERSKGKGPAPRTREDNGLITLRYEEAVLGAKPIPVTVAPPRKPPTDLHPALRVRNQEQDEGKRDSGLSAPTTSSLGGFREGSVLTNASRERDECASASSGLIIDFDWGGFQEILNTPQTPKTPERHGAAIDKVTSDTSGSVGSPAGSMRRWRVRSRKEDAKRRDSGGNISLKPVAKRDTSNEDAQIQEELEEDRFSPITTPIPSAGFLEDDFIDSMSFSKRGSIMFGGEKAVNGHLRFAGGRRQPSISMLACPAPKALPEDVEKESQKVRSMYEQGVPALWEDGRDSSMTQRLNIDGALQDPFVANTLLNPGTSDRPESGFSFRQEYELAGGIEDWEDVNGRDVDRYGFISKRRSDSPGSPEARPPQRVSTVLHLASETPRKKRGFGRSASTATKSNTQPPGPKISARSLNTQASSSSQRSISRVRSITNHLPGNQDRKLRDEAGDMLTLPPGLADIAEDEEGGRAAESLKKKEWERAEKWRKMAKIIKPGTDGEGMEFEFDAKNPKLIERTWKGIPDRWRAAAWYSFLASSAKKKKDSPTEEDIIAAFHRLLQVGSGDDQQIDTDVPRTINSHIMFRKRYRGGQRLLFRVLHCLSLYFPDTGYVQGMASLAATLLCYYDEEKAFVMLVRMWTLRGLAKLYASGFGGLMAALDEFHAKWMRGREVSKKLDELNIEPTSYGTRWYLTLFGYSIPFPAQLRVWDVFMLLGDSDPPSGYLSQSLASPTLPRTPQAQKPTSPNSPPSSQSLPNSPRSVRLNDTGIVSDKIGFHGGLDVLHATSAALIDGTREILLDSDFENAMKVLTSWIPVKDEELLMKVAKAEWKLIRGKRR